MAATTEGKITHAKNGDDSFEPIYRRNYSGAVRLPRGRRRLTRVRRGLSLAARFASSCRFSAGGAVDGPTRGDRAGTFQSLGQQVIVENKPGAGATIGSDAVAKSPPDGYTLLLASQTNAISASLYLKLPFNPLDDFAPISLLGREPGVLVVHPSLPVRTVQELIAYVKERPGKIDYASSGNGSGQHLFAAMFASMAGISMSHVPYRGSGQATTDLIGGQVLVSIPGLAGMLGHIKSGRLRALAVTGVHRSPQLPEVPTLAESGLKGYSAYVWLGLLAPRGTRRLSSTDSTANWWRCSHRAK